MLASKENNGNFYQENDKWVAPEKDSPTKRNTRRIILLAKQRWKRKYTKSDRNIFLWFIPIIPKDERERASERKCGIEAPRNSGRKSNVNEPNERVHSWTIRTEIAAFNFFLSCIGADFQMLNSDPKEETKQQNQKKNTQKIAKPIL